MTLDVAIATHQPQGINRVAAMQLPRVGGVRYVVSWQNHGDAPIPDEVSSRGDILVFRTDATCISQNRNNAVNHCNADIVLNGDDDLKYTERGLKAVINTFENDSEVEVACFKFIYNHDANAKPYPDKVCNLKRMPKNFWVTTFEMAVRRSSDAGNIRFDERFGPGSEFLGTGEDEIFLVDARRKKCVCKFYPIVIGEHPDRTHASQVISDVKIIHGFGAVIAKTYRFTALPRLVLKAWRLHKARQHSFLSSLVALFRGYCYVLTH